MGKFGQKLKEFGSKIVTGIKKGLRWVKEKAIPWIKEKGIPMAQKIAPSIAGALGHPEAGEAIAQGADKAKQILGMFG